MAMAGMVLVLGTASALAEISYLPFSNAPSSARDIAQSLMAAEAGAPIEGERVSVSEVDLNADGEAEIFAYAQAPFFCAERGCLPRIFRKTGGEWKNVLADDTGITRGSPANISLVGMPNDGFTDILLGSLLIEWDGATYREAQPPPRTDLADAAFLAACGASKTVDDYLAAEGVGDKDATFCACMVDQFENAGLPQPDLDRAATDYGKPRKADNPDDFLMKVYDFELGCRIDLTVD
jgi:hypothetical protein